MAWVNVGGAVAGAVVGGVLNKGSGSSQQYVPNNTSGSTSTQTSSSYSPNQALMPSYNNMLGQMNYLSGQPRPFFPGQTYVGPSSPTQAGVNAGMGAMPYYQQGAGMHGQASPLFQQGAGMAQGAIPGQQGINNMSLGNYGFLSRAADVANNPYVQGQLAANNRQVTQALNEQWLPQVNAGAQEVNALGSTRHGVAQAQATERAANQLANTNASTMLGAYGQGLTAQQNALGQTGNMLQNQLAPAMSQQLAGQMMGQAGQAQGQAGDMMNQAGQTGLQYGQVAEDYQQRALQDAMNRFNWQYDEPYQRMNNMLSMMSSNPMYSIGLTQGSGAGTSASSGMMPNPNYQSPYSAVIGGALQGYGAANAWQKSRQPQYNQQMANTLSNVF